MHIDERAVAAAWERQSFPRAGLQALGLSVVFRGLPSDAGGPDYQDAILSRQDGTLVHGDVEFHVRSSDWYRHGHHRSGRYNDVALHVVWHDDGRETIDASGRSVPVLAVGVDGAHSPRLQPVLLPHPCLDAYGALPTAGVWERVREAGIRRFRDLSEVYAADLGALDPDQVAYTALLESMGHASNRAAFRALADVVPYHWLREIPPVLASSALLDAAGLGPSSGLTLPSRLPPASWRLVRLRPANHPARRIEAVARLLAELHPAPAAALRRAVSSAHGPAELRRLLRTRAEGGAIGAGRADEMAVSAVLPLVAAFDPRYRQAEVLFLAWPSPPHTRWTRLMLDLLHRAGHDVTVRRAVEHQGLHALYHRHCRLGRNVECPVCAPLRHPAQAGTYRTSRRPL